MMLEYEVNVIDNMRYEDVESFTLYTIYSAVANLHMLSMIDAMLDRERFHACPLHSITHTHACILQEQPMNTAHIVSWTRSGLPSTHVQMQNQVEQVTLFFYIREQLARVSRLGYEFRRKMAERGYFFRQ
jgi:hypothetical protein